MMDLFDFAGIEDPLPDWIDRIKAKIDQLEQCNALQNWQIVAYTACEGIYLGNIIAKRKKFDPGSKEPLYRAGYYDSSFTRGSIRHYPPETKNRRKLENSPFQFSMHCPTEGRHENWKPWIWKSEEHEQEFVGWFKQTYPDVQISQSY